MIVYRIENDQGCGPFTEGMDCLLNCPLPTPHSPGEPFEDRKDIPYIYIFGFLYINDLYKWMGEYLDELADDGFEVVEILIPEDEEEFVLLGESGQIAFHDPGMEYRCIR